MQILNLKCHLNIKPLCEINIWTKVYLGSCHTSVMELLAKIGKSFNCQLFLQKPLSQMFGNVANTWSAV